MIKNIIKFKPCHVKFISTFNGKATHWDGRTPLHTSLRGAIRKHYLHEQKYHCAYCNRLRQDQHGYNWDIDHIIPKSTHAHFTYEPKNFAISCKECNGKKDNYNVLVKGVNAKAVYPVERGDYLIIHPHFDDYEVHITVKYTADLKIYHIPNSPKGTFTFLLCGLERFTEEIAQTSEYVTEEEVTIGYADDTFNKFYEGFRQFSSLYSSQPEIQSMLFSRFLADETGLEPEELASAIEYAQALKKLKKSPGLLSPSQTKLLPRPSSEGE